MAKNEKKAGETALAVIDPEKVARLDRIVASASLMVTPTMGHLERSLALADGIEQLERSIDDQMMSRIMRLCGKSIGFKTDKDAKPAEEHYPLAVVRRCVVEALLRGLHLVGNEFNIISARVYVTKEGLHRLVNVYPGVADLVLTPGVPHLTADKQGALVPFTASWRQGGKPVELLRDVTLNEDGKIVRDRRICVRVDAYTGIDAILGKATRKMLAAIFDQLSGCQIPIPEGDVTDQANGDHVVDARPALGAGDKPAAGARGVLEQLQASLVHERRQKEEAALAAEARQADIDQMADEELTEAQRSRLAFSGRKQEDEIGGAS